MPLQHCYLSLWATSKCCGFMFTLMSTRLSRVNTIMSSWSTGVTKFLFDLSPGSFGLMLHIRLAFSIRSIMDIPFTILYTSEAASPWLNFLLLTFDIIGSILCLIWKLLISIMINRSLQGPRNIFHMGLKTEVIICRVLHWLRNYIISMTTFLRVLAKSSWIATYLCILCLSNELIF